MARARPDRSSSPEQARESQHIDELIDEAGRESFPASDPMAITPPARRPSGGEQRDDRRTGHDPDEPARPAD